MNRAITLRCTKSLVLFANTVKYKLEFYIDYFIIHKHFDTLSSTMFIRFLFYHCKLKRSAVSTPSFNQTSFSDQVYEAKFSRFLGGHVQRIGNTSCKVRTLPRRGEGDAILRWYENY